MGKGEIIMLLIVHIKGGSKHIFEISQMMYDKEDNVIWFENGTRDARYWISMDTYFDNRGVWIDRLTLENYKISLVDRLGINMNKYTELENIYNLIEKSLMQFGQAHIVLDPYKK
jgi:hypothetical protein